MDALFDPDEVLVQFPVWILVHPDSTAAFRLLGLPGPAGAMGTPVFTNQELAQLYQSG
jgi:hypothetical protein